MGCSDQRRQSVNKADTAKLASYQKQYRALAAQLGAFGYIASGSLAQRYNRCGKANCACHADPPRLHGPYWQWTARSGGFRTPVPIVSVHLFRGFRTPVGGGAW